MDITLPQICLEVRQLVSLGPKHGGCHLNYERHRSCQRLRCQRHGKAAWALWSFPKTGSMWWFHTWFVCDWCMRRHAPDVQTTAANVHAHLISCTSERMCVCAIVHMFTHMHLLCLFDANRCMPICTFLQIDVVNMNRKMMKKVFTYAQRQYGRIW